jgi:iron(III) transport system ATP-binding protein
MLTLKNITKHFDKKVVVDDITLDIERGQIVSLLGPSGSGKTTILNIILGLIRPDQGQVIFNDKDITQSSMEKRGFNIVFQDFGLFPNLNAYDNIAYGLRNCPDVMTRGELEDLIDFLELRPHLDKMIHQLSGGQKQRVALARTLVLKPKVLLLDEPLSALDGVIKETIKNRIIALTKKYNLTTIIVTHDPEEALTLSDKVLIIKDGKVAQYGQPSEIVHKPTSNFIKTFILQQLEIKRENILRLFGAPYEDA